MQPFLKAAVALVNRLLDVPSTDPDDARRRKLLNILLLGVAAIGVLMLFTVTAVDILGISWEEGQPDPIGLTEYLDMLFLLAITAIVYAINRYGPGWLASTLFLLFLIAAMPFADAPEQVANGRSLLMFAIPIMMGSVLLRPQASFLMALLSGLVITIIAATAQLVPNLFAVFTFLWLALISWLAARSLEHALQDLRVLNRELDHRVEERTREVAEALSKNQAILEGIADGVIVFDTEGTAIVANPAIAALLGRPADEIMGRDIRALASDGMSDEDRELFIGLLEDQEVRYPSVRFGWNEKTLSVSVAPVWVADDDLIGNVAVFRDFTREAELDRVKSMFVSIASHELRTPLSAIMGFADMLQAGACGPLSAQQRTVVERIIANTGEMLSLANNLLDQAQVEAGKLVLDYAPFALDELVDSVQGTMAVLAHTKGLEMVAQISEDVPATIIGDRQRLHQILVNLVGNAIKFTEEGTVGVRVYRPDATHWALEVSDTGRGIPPEDQVHIFEPFRQVDDPATREQRGAGLGLSIVKQLVTLMLGDIELKSKVGQGSTFTIILPLTAVEEQEEQS